MPFAHNGPAKLAWEAHGSGPPLVLVMGHRFSSAMWRPVLGDLAAERRVITFDNRGTGGSNTPPGPYTMRDLAEDAFAVVTAAGVEAAPVYGVSMGGMIAQVMALLAPQRVTALILGCTSPRMPLDKPPGRLRNLQYWLPTGLTLGLAKKVLYGSVADPKAVEDDLALLRRDRFDPRGLMRQAQAIAGFDVQDRLSEIRQPTLILHGDEDKVVAPAFGDQLAAGIPDSRLVVLKGSGHNYVADAPAASNRAVIEFLREVG